MPKYIVAKNNMIKHDGLFFTAGEVVEMSESEALAASHAIEGPAPAGAAAQGNPLHPVNRDK